MHLRMPDRRSPAWVLIEGGTSAVLSLLSMLVIGRVIGPAEAGAGAVAIAAFLLLDVLAASLFSDALVQWPRLQAIHARTALTTAVLLGLGTATVLATTAPLLEMVADQPGMVWLLLALAPLLPFSAFSGVASALAAREQRFRLLALRVLVAQPIALGAGLAAAAAGFGAWAIVVNQIVVTMLVFVLFVAVGRVPLHPALDRAALRDLWPVAGPQIGALVLMLGRYRVFILALGVVVAEAVLAQAHFAFRLLDAALSVVWQATRGIATPRLCAVQGDRAALARCYGQVIQLHALIGLPVALGVALVAHDLVAALLGPDWAGMADAARIAGLAAAFSFLHGNHFSLFIATGQARWNLRLAALDLGIPLLVLAAFLPRTPEGIALAWASQHILAVPLAAGLVLRELGRSPLWLLRQAWPAIAGAGALVPAVLLAQAALPEAAALPRLVIGSAAGALAYVVVAWLALGWRLPAAVRRGAAWSERGA